MAVRLGDHGWLAELTSHRLNIAECLDHNASEEILSILSWISVDHMTQETGAKEVPTMLGAPFWMNLRGLVFDFAPGDERVGFIPREQFCDRNGVNSLFVSAASTKRDGLGGMFAVAVCTSTVLFAGYLV